MITKLYTIILFFLKRSESMAEYVFKMKKGDVEIELKSDDTKFIEEQLNKWREDILKR